MPLCMRCNSRGEICLCRHYRRQCKIFASSVNFSIFTHLSVFSSPKLLKFGENEGVKFLYISLFCSFYHLPIAFNFNIISLKSLFINSLSVLNTYILLNHIITKSFQWGRRDRWTWWNAKKSGIDAGQTHWCSAQSHALWGVDIRLKAMVEEDRHDDHWHDRRSRRASRGRRARWPRRWWGRRPRRGPTCLSVWLAVLYRSRSNHQSSCKSASKRLY